MSEYQRYEFMTIDRPLTRAQLDAVNALSSHIEASSTHALIEYHWGDFKHDPIKVLREFFDGFLYWANWGAPELAFRFPHGILPADLIDGYDLDEFVTFTRHPDYDLLDIHFGEMEAPDEWIEYELGSLIAIRDELMEGDLRALYIVWLAGQRMIEGYDEEEEEEEEDWEIIVPPVPPGFGMLTAAQQALAELLQVPQELLDAAARNSNAAMPSPDDNFVAWVELLPQARRSDYLVRLAHNEPGLSRLLVRELRELSQGKTIATPSTGERVTYATLLAESKAIKARLEREKREQEQLARQRHLQEIHDHQDAYWHQVDQAVTRSTGTGYDEATRVLIELREAAEQFKESQEFQARFRAWVRPHLRRPAFVKRLQYSKFILPEA
jgi:chorismate mutase